jgi:hypothetical protein
MTLPSTPVNHSTPGTPGSRVVSAVELLLGTAIVVGHNVLRVLPNEVPILFVIGSARHLTRRFGH